MNGNSEPAAPVMPHATVSHAEVSASRKSAGQVVGPPVENKTDSEVLVVES